MTTIRVVLAILIFLFLLIPLTIYLAIKEQKKWDAFSIEHNCRVVGKITGSSQTGFGVGITANGQIGTIITTSSIPQKTGWLCDNGITYWR